MPTLTLRNVPRRVVDSLKRLAREHGRSMEQEAKQILAERTADRAAALASIEASWALQSRPTTAVEVSAWVRASRP